MFSYYGSKSKVIQFYPKPRFDKIIEPFAGSARYALKYWDREIIIIEKNDVIFRIWEYLQRASEKDILGLPKLKQGDDIRALNLSQIEKEFLGMMFGSVGSPSPCWTVSPFGDAHFLGDSLGKVAKNLFKIKHWQILNQDCFDFPNQTATWFIDPPYQFGGHKYKFGNKQLDFEKLAQWCMTRDGHVIVCENSKANWLPFVPITTRCDNLSNFHKSKTVECIWTNVQTSYSATQQQLF